jgi:hypothetical protein
VERLAGSAGAKARLGMILEALAGRRTVAQACRALGLGERRFHALRHRALQAALEALEPRPGGRPARQAAGGDWRVAALEAALRDLKFDLRAAQVREEIALAVPHLLRPRGGKKGARRKARTRRAGKSGAPGGCGPSRRPAAGPPGGGARPASATSGGWSAASAPAPSPSAAGRPASG